RLLDPPYTMVTSAVYHTTAPLTNSTRTTSGNLSNSSVTNSNSSPAAHVRYPTVRPPTSAYNSSGPSAVPSTRPVTRTRLPAGVARRSARYAGQRISSATSPHSPSSGPAASRSTTTSFRSVTSSVIGY